MIYTRWASTSTRQTKQLARWLKRLGKAKLRDSKDITSRSNVLFYEVQEALRQVHPQAKVDTIANPVDLMEAFYVARHRPFVEVDVDIVFQLTEGGGIGFVPKSYANGLTASDIPSGALTAVYVPKCVVGDRVRAKLTVHHHTHTEADLVKVLEPSPRRDDNLIVCNKFDRCSGCAFQMVSYEDQLQTKQLFIQRAYRYFYPALAQDEGFGFVVESPLQYLYRNKLTPHYKLRKDTVDYNEVPIGMLDVRLGTVDVDHCPIATPAINKALPFVRKQAREAMSEQSPREYTLLLRDSLHVEANGNHRQVCLEGPNKIITQKVGKNLFQFNLLLFFQNNSFIMPDIIDYIKHYLEGYQYKYVIDAYCGLGYFSVALAKGTDAEKTFGIEIDKELIKYATHNAKLNGMGEKVTFVQGDATNMFDREEFKELNLTGDDTVVVMDPSRKGLTPQFMQQLYEFGPKVVVYVSCNVMTQARDLAMLERIGKETNGVKYKVLNVVGFDLFPQTKHVETVAILERI